MKAKEFFRKLDKFGNVLYPLIGVGLFFLLWFIVAKSIATEMILPEPKAAFARFFVLLGGAEFWRAVGNTLLRTLFSFGLSFVAAWVLAVVGYLLPPLHKMLSPLMTVLRATPTMSIILLSLIWLSSALSPVLITCLIVFPLLYAAFYGALNGVDRGLIEMSRVYRVPVIEQIKSLFIPAVLPTVLTAARSNVSLALKVMIASEVLAQTRSSMGVNMNISRLYLDTAELLGWTVMAILLSYALELAVLGLEKLLIKRK